jgi:hypothetical protein
VISLGSVPGGSRVACEARVRIAAPRMLSLVIGLMTGHAVVGSGGTEEGSAPPRGVAAGAEQGIVSPLQSVPVRKDDVVRHGSFPGRNRVTIGALGGVTGAGVLPLVIVLVAPDTVLLAIGRWEAEAATGEMAPVALEFQVSAHKPESARKRRVVERRHIVPRSGRMARQAVAGKPQGDVIYIFRPLEVLLVACQAITRQGRERPPLVGRVTALTGELEVGSFEGKRGGLMEADAGDFREALGSVAPGTVG